eukprot:scaffold949_cov90-Cylindrotheca_fusiformis.AAC.1
MRIRVMLLCLALMISLKETTAEGSQRNRNIRRKSNRNLSTKSSKRSQSSLTEASKSSKKSTKKSRSSSLSNKSSKRKSAYKNDIVDNATVEPEPTSKPTENGRPDESSDTTEPDTRESTQSASVDDESPDTDTDEDGGDRDGEVGGEIDVPESFIVQVKIESELDDMCLSYAANDSFVKTEKCSTTTEESSGNDDHWEKIELPNGLLGLRHRNTQLCIPQNPEHPGSSFDCFASSGAGEAIADRISGLVNCSSPYIASMGFLDSRHPMYLYQEQCASENLTEAEMDVILMTYVENGSNIVVWGEKILLSIANVVSNLKLKGNWSLTNVQ